MASFGLGIVGFGRLARQYYVPALRGLHGVDELLVADPLEASREAARRALPGARVFADPGEMLAQDPRAVIVASPPSTHLALWRAAAGQGIPVLVEKPFVLNGELADATGTPREQELLMIDFNRRFWGPYRQAAALVRSGAIGEIVGAELTLRVDVRPWCTVTAHRLDPAEGGALFDLGSQVLDLITWLIDMEPCGVRATMQGPSRPADDLQIDLFTPGGTAARCSVAYGRRTGERLTIVGRLGRLRMADPNMGLHLERRGTTSPRAALSDLAILGWRGVFRSRSMSRRSIALAIDAFVDGVRRSVPFSPGFADAARNTRLLEAAARSLELGTPVELPAAGARMVHG
jgi:scyllo-inositol 2-dehydrogenase (NADP+)